MAEFGINAYGVDISQRAIDLSKQMAKYFNQKVNFNVYDGKHLDFCDEFFDFSICLGGVLNCIPEAELQNIANELERVTKTYICIAYITEKVDKNGKIPDIGIVNLALNIEKLFKKFKLISKTKQQNTNENLSTKSEFLIFKNSFSN